MSADLFGTDLFGEPIVPPSRGTVSDRFVFPPFSIFDTRSGEWQDRRRAWLATGIKSETGRAERTFHISEWLLETKGFTSVDTSIFDPVVCELTYRWFSPPGGQVVDPFAGGSVRGLVASGLGRQYWGSDLSATQLEANRAQVRPDDVPAPVWVHGDSRETLGEAPDADLVFSCPPYGDLERYSDDPRDLSTMDYGAFLHAYRDIITKALARLRRDRFAVFVVAGFRDQFGFYRDFVGDTVDAFEQAGARFYNDAVLINVAGTAAMRVTKQFVVSRKFAKTHQNILVFVKGDPRAATAACGPVASPAA